MLKKLIIRNFKAINQLTIKFTPLTILIGENSCGKSTVLQALDFLCSIASRDIDEYLKDRDWDFNDVKSQFCRAEDKVSFSAEFDINGTKLLWSISINYNSSEWIIAESIKNIESGQLYLSFGSEQNDFPYEFSQLNVKSSALKMLDINVDSKVKYSPILIQLKTLLTSSNSFELLSPDRMRSRGSRGKVKSIGMGGEKLAAYVHGMHSLRRNELNRQVSEYIGYDVKITTTTKGQPGWVEMFLEETWNDVSVRVKKRYLSDGLLRIIALSAILINQESKKTLPDSVPKGFLLLDEIEDGINFSLAEKLITQFKETAEKYKKQAILTSHSPVVINFADESTIQFMWRDAAGCIHAKPLFETEKMKETLDFLQPGEVWLNYSKKDIIEKLGTTQEDEH